MNDATQDFVRPGYETQSLPSFPMLPPTGPANRPRKSLKRKVWS